mmetsp:Transcript_40346/g.95892  ORF Transcript_40346/g.95892 Transcript_40346/m.95892 type:complete len:212 (+) Transcript_40346:1490-2125(+)
MPAPPSRPGCAFLDRPARHAGWRCHPRPRHRRRSFAARGSPHRPPESLHWEGPLEPPAHAIHRESLVGRDRDRCHLTGSSRGLATRTVPTGGWGGRQQGTAPPGLGMPERRWVILARQGKRGRVGRPKQPGRPHSAAVDGAGTPRAAYRSRCSHLQHRGKAWRQRGARRVVQAAQAAALACIPSEEGGKGGDAGAEMSSRGSQRLRRGSRK